MITPSQLTWFGCSLNDCFMEDWSMHHNGRWWRWGHCDGSRGWLYNRCMYHGSMDTNNWSHMVSCNNRSYWNRRLDNVFMMAMMSVMLGDRLKEYICI